MSYLRFVLAIALMAGFSLATTAAPLPIVVYSTDFETDQSANFTTISTGATPNGVADYAYSYTDLGAPGDVRSGTGMYFQVKTLSQSDSADPNYASEAGAAVIGGALTSAALGGPVNGSFKLNFDMYTSSAPPGSGTTEFGTVWVNGDGASHFPFSDGNYALYKTTDGDSSRDYRLYNGLNYTDNPFYNATAGDQTDGWKQWQAWEISVDTVAKTVSVSVDGVAVSSTDFLVDPFVGGLPTFGHSDSSGNSSADASAQFILFDNLTVSTVPEPASLLLLSTFLFGFAATRRR